jgi:hypothetical protein
MSWETSWGDGCARLAPTHSALNQPSWLHRADPLTRNQDINLSQVPLQLAIGRDGITTHQATCLFRHWRERMSRDGLRSTRLE